MWSFETCIQSGVYEPNCSCRNATIGISRGEEFPLCLKCHKVVQWTYRNPLWVIN